MSFSVWSILVDKFTGLTSVQGEVVQGMDLVKTVEKLGSQSGKVTGKVSIAASGVV
jgi:peptidylprolyl isomerase